MYKVNIQLNIFQPESFDIFLVNFFHLIKENQDL